MENAIVKLEEIKNTKDIEKIKLALDRFKRAANEDNSQHKFYLDHIIKAILQNTNTAEFFDRIEDLFGYIRDPRNFLDELDSFTSSKVLIVPTLMFIFQLGNSFNFEYEEFYEKLYLTVQKDNCSSEGYLLFLLKALKDHRIDNEKIEPILRKLSEVSVEVSTKNCVKILYTIIVLLRMHPGLFRKVKNMNQLYILLRSTEPVARISRRIFVEAENPEMRPSMVFLENFVFPGVEE